MTGGTGGPDEMDNFSDVSSVLQCWLDWDCVITRSGGALLSSLLTVVCSPTARTSLALGKLRPDTGRALALHLSVQSQPLCSSATHSFYCQYRVFTSRPPGAINYQQMWKVDSFEVSGHCGVETPTLTWCTGVREQHNLTAEKPQMTPKTSTGVVT